MPVSSGADSYTLACRRPQVTYLFHSQPPADSPEGTSNEDDSQAGGSRERRRRAQDHTRRHGWQILVLFRVLLSTLTNKTSKGRFGSWGF